MAPGTQAKYPTPADQVEAMTTEEAISLLVFMAETRPAMVREAIRAFYKRKTG